jgi:hypothetical protein
VFGVAHVHHNDQEFMHTSFMENILLVNMVDVSVPIKSISCKFGKKKIVVFFFLTIIYEAHLLYSLIIFLSYRKRKKERPKLLKGVGLLLHIIKEGKGQRMLRVELLWAL